MALIRALYRDRPALLALLFAAALLLRAVVPAGFMLGASEGQSIAVYICAGADSAMTSIAIPIDGDHDRGDDAGMTKGDCAFSAHGLAMTGPVDAPLLAAAFSFILLLGLAPTRLPWIERGRHRRPPLRGPPEA